MEQLTFWNILFSDLWTFKISVVKQLRGILIYAYTLILCHFFGIEPWI